MGTWLFRADSIRDLTVSFFHWLVGLVAFLVILLFGFLPGSRNLAPAGIYALILFATAGMGVLASARTATGVVSA